MPIGLLGKVTALMRLSYEIRLLIMLVCLASAIVPASVSAEDTLLAYAVNVQRTPAQPWTGVGIYLGRDLFITAAHVVGRAWITRPKIAIAGREYPTHVLKEGSLETVDLTLLRVEERLLPMRLRLRNLSLCARPPRPGDQVLTVVPGQTIRSHIISSDRLPPEARRYTTVIADVPNSGNSGSGVFDAQSGCLLGIISRRISTSRSNKGVIGKAESRGLAKYFVPASEIAAFLPPGALQ